MLQTTERNETPSRLAPPAYGGPATLERSEHLERDVAAEEHAIERELRLAAPRRTRFTKSVRAGRQVAINVFCAALFLTYLGGAKDVGTMDAAARQGEVTTATVTDKHVKSEKSKSGRLSLRFEGAGQTVFTIEKVRRAEYDGVNKGDTRTVTYLPSNPEIHYFGEVTPERVQGRQLRWLIFGGIGAALVALLFFAVEAERHRIRRLLRVGFPAVGSVVKRQQIDGNATTYRITYHYPVGGQWHKGYADVCQSRYDSLPVGTAFTVLYDPANPASAIPYGLSDAAEIEGAPARDWPPRA